MSPELISAVKERIKLGHSDDAIKEELRGAGYTDEMLDQVLAEAKGGPTTIPPAGGEVALPGVIELFKSSFSAAFSRVDVLMLLLIPMIITTVLVILLGANIMAEEPTFTPAARVVSLIGTLIYIFFLFATVYIVSNSGTIKEGIAWVKKNGLSLIWINILVSCAVWGGLGLFLVPGIIVSIYLYLSQFALVREGLKGMDALMRSRELVYGKWLPVFGRLLGVVGLSLIVAILIYIPVGILSFVLLGEDPEAIASASKSVMILFGLIDNLVSVPLTVFGLFVGIKLFSALAAAKPVFDQEASMSARKKYKILAWLGPVFLVLVIMAAFSLAPLEDASEEGLEAAQQEIDSINAKEKALELRDF